MEDMCGSFRGEDGKNNQESQVQGPCDESGHSPSLGFPGILLPHPLPFSYSPPPLIGCCPSQSSPGESLKHSRILLVQDFLSIHSSHYWALIHVYFYILFVFV